MIVIAAAFTLIALNPWIGPERATAQDGITRVDIKQIGGTRIPYAQPIPVRIVTGDEWKKR